MIKIHHLNNSRSQRILWLLEELELPYEVIRYNRDAKTMLAPPELRKIHPLGKSPVLEDGEMILAESGAIIEYILDKYSLGRLTLSSGTKEYYRMKYWLHYAEGSLMSPLLLSLIFAQIPKQPVPFFVKPILKAISDKVISTFVQPQIDLHFNYLENELKKNEWFANEKFTAADIQMSFAIEAAQARGVLKNHPKLDGFLAKIHSRSAYKKALEKGGPYELLS